MTDHWILDDAHNLVEVDLLTWARWLEEHRFEKIVKQEAIGQWFISTVFLGLDHGFGATGPPILFETMIFDRSDESHKCRDCYCERYTTWDEAAAGHAHITAYVTACGRPPGDERRP